MYPALKRFLDYVGSRSFAIILLTGTLAIILVSNLLPNISIMSKEEIDALRVSRPLFFALAGFLQIATVAKSPFFLVIPVSIFASVAACTLKRIKREGWRAIRVAPGDVKYRGGFAGSPESAVLFLRKKGWTAGVVSQESGDAVIVGHKGMEGFWGSVLFHAGMNVAILGFGLSVITGFNASIMLTDGYGVKASEAFLGKKPTEEFPFPEMLMESFNAVYLDGFPVDYSMELTLWDGEGRERKGEVKVNHPLKWKGYQFVPNRYGFSPEFIIKKDGKEVLNAFVNLVVITPDQIDYFEAPDEGMKVACQFFPDFYMEGKVPKTRSKEPKNPVFFVEIKQKEKVIGRGFLHLNKEVSFPGYSIELKDIRRWVLLDVSRDTGVPVITFGFIFIVAGLIIRFLRHERHIWLYLRDGAVEAGGRSRYSPALFEDELKKLAEEMGQGGKGEDQ